MGYRLDVNIIRTRRTEMAWTQELLAQAAEIHVKTVRRAEAGKKISGESTLAIAGALKVDVAALVKRGPLIVVAFANEAAGTGKTFYALTEAVMAQHDGLSSAIVAFAPPAMSCFDDYAVDFCREYGIAHQRAEPGGLRQALEAVGASVVFIDTPPRIAGGALDAFAYYRELAAVCDYIIVPVKDGPRAERATHVTVSQLRRHTNRLVLLPYEVLPGPLGWISGVTAYGKRLGIVTLDWLTRHPPDFKLVKESYRRALGAGDMPRDLDEESLGAFFGIWTDIRSWVLPPEFDLLGRWDIEPTSEMPTDTA
jgi:transcriptional regulator with XRE-family HTH domain